ncbi:hypothetical protein PIB30_011222 [Stylosanthes scabra]|uniref:Uncharacterized protein n=1 Tax=Stylosanthes scabra TaxID=79078 RepID=A0ABU6T5I6_9FABA|nr:hypothetical protein [Stylosanthes scabra]
MVFLMPAVETLHDLKEMLLRKMYLGSMHINRIAYRLHVVFPKKCLLVMGGFFSEQVIQLYVELVETSTTTAGTGPSNSGHDGGNLITTDPIQFATPGDRTGDESKSNEDYLTDIDEGSCVQVDE